MKRSLPVVIAACLSFALAQPVRAQESTINPQKLVVKDSLITVLPWRSTNEIAAGIENAKALLSQAETKRMLAQNLFSYLESRLELKQKEIDLLDKRIDIADDAKNETEVASLKQEMKVAKNLLDILKSQSSVREAEKDLASAEYDHAGTLQIALELEQQFARQRSELAMMASTGAAEQAGVNQKAGDLIAQTLEAQLDAAKKEQKCADRRRDLAAQRVKLHALQRTYTASTK